MNTKDSTLWEQLSKGLGEAITDIRQKVVEEPMWGRAVTGESQQAQLSPEPEQQPAFGSKTTVREFGPERQQWGWPKAEERTQERGHEREPERDIER